MALRNVLVEGVSGSGKTSVCRALQRRGYRAVNGDTELVPDDRGPSPSTAEGVHEQHVWDVQRVRAIAADHESPVAFFCGGSRNLAAFRDVFDLVLVLHVDEATLRRRLAVRGPDEFGGRPEERALILRLHRTGVDLPSGGIPVDATAPLDLVVEEVLRRADSMLTPPGRSSAPP